MQYYEMMEVRVGERINKGYVTLGRALFPRCSFPSMIDCPLIDDDVAVDIDVLLP